MFDPATSAPAIAPVVSDARGRFRIEGLAPGAYYLVAWPGGQMIQFDSPGAALRISAGRTLTHDIAVGRYPYFRDDAPAVQGTVLDADTGRPIPGAFVSVGDSDLPALFSGVAVPWEAVADEAGRFLLTQVPVVSSGPDHPLGLYPVMAAAAGYEPRATGSLRRGLLLPLPAVSGEVLTVELRLQARRGTGSISGQVSSGASPRPGVSVGVAFVDSASSGASARRLQPRSLVPEVTTVTDMQGHFLLNGLAPGTYRVHAAYLPDDGWVAEPAAEGHENDNRVIVSAGGQATCRIQLLPALRLLEPMEGAPVSTARPRFSWGGQSGADFYRLRFSNANGFLLPNARLTEDTTLVAPPGYWGDGDWVRWTVEAYQGDSLVGASERIATFVVRSRGGPGL